VGERRRQGSAKGLYASYAAFLASDLAKNISGQCIAVTAGEPAG
jgi:hypothetical protein